MQDVKVRIGTRGSPLALAQARDVAGRLQAAHGRDRVAIEIEIIKTSGDRIQDRPLSEVGGKGLFTKEIEEALLSGTIDLAVHSMKDLETKLPPGLAIAAVLEREDVRDGFVSLRHAGLDEVPPGATIGTSSLRREAQVRRLRPDLKVVGFRGNVETRLAKLEAGVADATLLACAGLNRLGQQHRITRAMSVDQMLPAVAQGAVGVEVRTTDHRVRDLLAALHHRPTAVCVEAERIMLAALDGSCRTPIAGLAQLDGDRMRLRGELIATDGSHCWHAERTGAASDGARLATEVAAEILAAAGSRRS